MDTPSFSRRQFLVGAGTLAAAVAGCSADSATPTGSTSAPPSPASTAPPASTVAAASTAATVATPVSRPSPTQTWTIEDSTPEPDGIAGAVGKVLVVGAGAAGLAAANALTAAGVEVVVLEGRDRVGGRVYTTELAGTPVDLGASWIHHPEGNPLSELARRLGIGCRPLPTQELLAGAALHDGTRWLGPKERRRVLAILGGFGQDLGPDTPLTTPLATLIDDYFTSVEADAADAAWARRLLVTSLEGSAAGPGQISLEEVAGALSGGDDVPVGGMASLIEPLASGVDVRTGVSVTAIEAGRDGVRVRDARGSVHTGSHVVVTVPLGVLKAGAIRFDPPLPDRHVSAIERLGFGVFEKVLVRAARDTWSEHGPLLVLGTEVAAYNSWVGLTDTAGAPVVMSLNGGDSGHAMLAEARGVRPESAVSRLGAVIDLTEPIALATDWAGDPHARGAYSFLTPTSGRGDLAALGRPAHGRILFAGEATSPDRHGYVDGAFASGLREARRLLGTAAATLTMPA